MKYFLIIYIFSSLIYASKIYASDQPISLPKNHIGYLKNLKCNYSVSDEFHVPSVYRGKLLYQFSKPVTHQKLQKDSDKHPEKVYPIPYEFHWVGNPEKVYLNSKPSNKPPKYSRQHRHDGPMDSFNSGEALSVDDGCQIEIHLRDQTIITLAGDTVFSMTSMTGEGQSKEIKMALIKGWFHFISKEPTKNGGQVSIETPNATFITRGLKGVTSTKIEDFYIYNSKDEDNISKSELLTIQGQVGVTYHQINRDQIAYPYSKVINPKTVFTISGRHGLGSELTEKKIEPNFINQEIQRLEYLR